MQGTSYFPDPDCPALRPFTQAFVRLMFAHAEFERRLLDLAGVISCNHELGQLPTARKRRQFFAWLIRAHEDSHQGGIPEASDILDCLGEAIAACDERNLMAHGHWWAFDTNAQAITVRGDVARFQQHQHQERTVAQIEAATLALVETESKLYRLQRSIQARTLYG